MLRFTLGMGLDRPRGTTVEAATLDDLLEQVQQHDGVEAWWSGHEYRDGYRDGDHWLRSALVVADVDGDGPMPADVRQRVVDAWEARAIPGDGLHLTPKGMRILRRLSAPCEDAGLWQAAARGFGVLVQDALAGVAPTLRVDEPATADRARLFFTPCATAKGAKRNDRWLNGRADQPPADVNALAALAPRAVPAPASRLEGHGVIAGGPARHYPTLDAARAAFNVAHPLPHTDEPGDCPACGHHGCAKLWGSKWFCFSANHERDGGGCGQRTSGGWLGDALDLAAHARGCTHEAVLVAEGLLPPRGDGAEPERDLNDTLDDTGNAERLLAHFGAGHVRCIDGWDWYVWDAALQRWLCDEAAVRVVNAASVEPLARAIKRDMEKAAPEPEEDDPDLKAKQKRRGRWLAHLQRARSDAGQKAALAVLAKHPAVAMLREDVHGASAEDHEAAYLMAFRDCVVDLRTGARIPNRPDLHVFRYNDTALEDGEPARWLACVRSIFTRRDGAVDEERVAFFLRALGISMFGRAARHVFILHGPTGTGKSAVLRRRTGPCARTPRPSTCPRCAGRRRARPRAPCWRRCRGGGSRSCRRRCAASGSTTGR